MKQKKGEAFSFLLPYLFRGFQAIIKLSNPLQIKALSIQWEPKTQIWLFRASVFLCPLTI